MIELFVKQTKLLKQLISDGELIQSLICFILICVSFWFAVFPFVKLSNLVLLCFNLLLRETHNCPTRTAFKLKNCKLQNVKKNQS